MTGWEDAILKGGEGLDRKVAPRKVQFRDNDNLVMLHRKSTSVSKSLKFILNETKGRWDPCSLKELLAGQ